MATAYLSESSRMERKHYFSGWPRPASTKFLEPLGNLAIHCLSRAARRVSTHLSKELALYELTLSDVEALREMGKTRRTSPTALARALGMSKGGISKLTDRLVNGLWITKKVDPCDRRCRVLELTKPAREMIPSLALLEATVDYKAFSVLGSEKWSDVPRALLLVGRRLSVMWQEEQELEEPTATATPDRSTPGTVRATSLDPKQAPLSWYAEFC
jgi:DNA-binding MarR family transcriptional regulator